MKTIIINGEKFEVYNPRKCKPDINHLAMYAGRTLNGCYANPSITKQKIYNEWLKWAIEANVDYFGVSSFNSNIFTLQGYIEIDGVIYILSITPKHNIATIVSRETFLEGRVCKKYYSTKMELD